MVSGWLAVGVPLIGLLLLVRSLWGVAALAAAARVVREAPNRELVPAPDPPHLLVLVPMLREQSVATQTLRAFATLPYAAGRAVVCVITTEREEEAKAVRRDQLAAIAASGVTAAALRGLFPAGRVPQVVAAVGALPPEKRADALIRFHDEEPTTADVVAGWVGAREPGGLPIVHLHQPVVAGRKASQLNHAVDHLPGVLSAAGLPAWASEDTYVVVYDADALPDRRTLWAFADLVARRRAAGQELPGYVQQHRFPTLARRPLPGGAAGLVLAAEWVWQVRRILAIEIARLLWHERVYGWPRVLRSLARPMVYGVGCGLAVRLPELHAIGRFPEPMEDIVSGFRLSLLGTPMAPLRVCVADEAYGDLASMVNLHSLVYSAYRRPSRQGRAVAGVSRLRRWERLLLTTRVNVDIFVWLVGAPLCLAAFVSAFWAGPGWLAVLAAGTLLWGPVPTVAVLVLRPVLIRAVPGAQPAIRGFGPLWNFALVVLSPFFQWIEMVGGFRTLWTVVFRRTLRLGKTER
jgi:hypothetical protein